MSSIWPYFGHTQSTYLYSTESWLTSLHDRASLSNSSGATGCDWARVSLCLVCGEGPSLVKCQMVGCACTLHHMCQTEWESAEEGREAQGSKKLCAYHHPCFANHPSCAATTLRKAAAPSGASLARAVPRYGAAKYPGVAVVAAAMDNAMARWKKMPGPVEWCGALYKEMCHGVYLQMVVSGVHFQHKRGANGLAWKDIYERTVGIRTG